MLAGHMKFTQIVLYSWYIFLLIWHIPYLLPFTHTYHRQSGTTHHNIHRMYDQRKEQNLHCYLSRRICLVCQRTTQNHRINNLCYGTLSHIGTTSHTITYHITDLISNRCEVAWIVFRDVLFDLTQEFSVDIRGLGVYPQIELHEDCDKGCSEAVSDEKNGKVSGV